MSVRFDINNRSDYIAEYNRLQKKVTAKIAAHQGPCGEDGDRGEDATGLITTSLNVATFLCDLMQFIEGPDNDTAPTITGDFQPNVPENTKFVGNYRSSEVLTWIVTGDNSALFMLDGGQRFGPRSRYNDTVDVYFITAPDYETQQNTYNINLIATDAADNSRTQALTITVTDVDDPAPTIITVSGGRQLTAPYYTFTANGASITVLQANTTYVFQRQDNATSHPFRINNEDPITGTSTITITTGAADSQIPWVCTSHGSMNGSFNVV